MCLNVVSGPCILDFSGVLQHPLYGSVDIQQPDSRFLAHSGHTGNVVRGIPHQSLQIHDLGRRHMKITDHCGFIIIQRNRLSPFGFRLTNHHSVLNQLQQIPVTGDDRYLHPRFFSFRRHGSQNIIRLNPGLRVDGYLHRRQHFLQNRHLFGQLIRHSLPGPLVFTIHLMTKRGCFLIKSHQNILRSLLLQEFQKNVQKSIDGIGMQPVAISQIRHTVKSPVDNTVAVDQHDFIRHSRYFLPYPL